MSSVLKSGLLGIFVLGMGLSPALAAPDAKKKDPAQAFSKLDSNSDGSLTLEEMKGKGKKDAAKIEKKFKKMDANGDGKVTLAEMKSGGKKMKKSKKG